MFASNPVTESLATDRNGLVSLAVVITRSGGGSAPPDSRLDHSPLWHSLQCRCASRTVFDFGTVTPLVPFTLSGGGAGLDLDRNVTQNRNSRPRHTTGARWSPWMSAETGSHAVHRPFADRR